MSFQQANGKFPSSPPQFVGSSGRGQALPNLERRCGPYGPRHEEKAPSTLTTIYLGSIVILLLCALSCILALYRNTKLMEQNLALLEKQISMRQTSLNDVEYVRTKKFDRMVSLKDECPPCPTTEPPNPIAPYKNPVSVLNEEVHNRANYDVVHTCLDPPIHEATLRITDDPAFEGKSWFGKGSSIQRAKQAAAWKAIQNDFSHLEGLVADEYKPPSLYNPVCNRPTPV